ncbi:glyoxalase [Cellulomonas sp. zg-ZUI222]|nr:MULTISPECIES: VOC family protein [Cellulomonas]MBO0899957.1 glyoxalase [Cellulomonas sp. zg-ZUI22]MBO0921129.1 glyoxalase [Cellulomonas wangleii]
MDRMIVVNLPARDLSASRAFYTGLGMAVDEMLSDDDVVCVLVSHTVCVMLLLPARFGEVTGLPVVDARAATQVVLCLAATSRADVDALAAGALAAGGTELGAGLRDGSPYARTVADPDGHVWELLHPDCAPPGRDAADRDAADV